MAKNPRIVVETPHGRVITYRSKGGTVTSKLEWDPAFGKSTTARFDQAQSKLDREIMKQMEPYMQMVTGAMINSMRLATVAGSGVIRVRTPYARDVYYSSSPVGRPTGPLRGPFYFERMKADKRVYLQEFAGKAAKAK